MTQQQQEERDKIVNLAKKEIRGISYGMAISFLLGAGGIMFSVWRMSVRVVSAVEANNQRLINVENIAKENSSKNAIQDNRIVSLEVTQAKHDEAISYLKLIR
jgi:hypothetical protein